MSVLDGFIAFFLNPWFIISLLFWIIVFVAVLLLRNKKGSYNLFFPLLALFKTKKLNRFIRKVSSKGRKFWTVFWNIGIFVSFGFTIFGFYFFFINLINLMFTPSIENAFVLLIPGVTIELPIFFYLLLPLLFVVTTHELAHGISASIDGVEIKSTGVMGVGVFYLVGFGAFVEVDERKLRSTKFHRNTRLRIAASGTFVNAITAGIAFVLFLSYPLLVSPFYIQVPQVYSVLDPSHGGFNYYNLEIGDAMVAIKMQGAPDESYVYLDQNQGIDLAYILNNNTHIEATIGSNLTFYTYNPNSDLNLEKNVLLGPRYSLGIEFRYPNETAMLITYNYTSEMTTNIHITKVNGTAINTTNGDTLQKYLTNFNLKTVNLTSDTGVDYLEPLSVEGVFVGVQSTYFWMHQNDFAKFFTHSWADFWQKTIGWLYVISFSITLFNMMPLPIFDGDRLIKELINSVFGESYDKRKTKKKVDRFAYKEDDIECNLSEYRVESVDYVKFLLKDRSTAEGTSEVILGEDNYTLVDKIGDGYKDTVELKMPENTTLDRKTEIQVSYDYQYDEIKRKKRIVINIIRVIALGLIAANFILSFMIFGFNLFWL